MPAKPILGSLNALEMNICHRNGVSLVSSFSNWKPDNSLLCHPSLRKLCIRHTHDYRTDDAFANLRGVSGVTDLSIEGYQREELLVAFLKCFKGLKTFEYALNPGRFGGSIDLQKLAGGLLVHRDTLEHLSIDLSVTCSLFSFAKFKQLRILTIPSDPFVNQGSSPHWVNRQCSPGIIARLLALDLPTSLKVLNFLGWGYLHGYNPNCSRHADPNPDLDPLRYLIPWLAERDGLPHLRRLIINEHRHDHILPGRFPHAFRAEMTKDNLDRRFAENGVQLVIE